MIIENEKVQLLEELCIGDMVWAKMPLPEDELSEIEPSHRIRPYLVIDKDTEAIYGYPASSKKSPGLGNFQICGINLNKFGYEKNSWLTLTELYKVPIDNLCSKMIHLDDHDLSMISKRLQIQLAIGNNVSQYKLEYKLDLPVEFEEGDVIQYTHEDNELSICYVYSADETKLICYPIILSYFRNTTWRKIMIDGKYAYVDFANPIIFTDFSKAKIIDIASNYEIAVINQIKKEVEHSVKKANDKLNGFEPGYVFNTIYGKFMYLGRTREGCCGINLFTYKTTPEVVLIPHIRTSKIVELKNKEYVNDVVKFLYQNLKQPSKLITWMYKNM